MSKKNQVKSTKISVRVDVQDKDFILDWISENSVNLSALVRSLLLNHIKECKYNDRLKIKKERSE